MVKRLKYEMCKNFREKGQCKYGDKCLFAHGEHELTKRSSLNGPEPKIKATETEKPTILKTEEKSEKEDSKSKQTEDKVIVEVTADKDTESEVKVQLFETPAKKDGDEEVLLTPAFSSAQEGMSTQLSTAGPKDSSASPVKELDSKDQTFSSTMARREDDTSSNDETSSKEVLAGDLNYLLDREMQKSQNNVP